MLQTVFLKMLYLWKVEWYISKMASKVVNYTTVMARFGVKLVCIKIWLTRKYDLQCINSIDRALLNEGLLEEVLARPEITVYFEHKCIAADFDSKVLTFCNVSPTNGEADVKANFDFCIGADGSYSIVRRQLMRYVR